MTSSLRSSHVQVESRIKDRTPSKIGQLFLLRLSAASELIHPESLVVGTEYHLRLTANNLFRSRG